MRDRSLEKEERMEMKHYSKLSNVFTPLIKLTASEACNSIAYDSLQIHGGTGFMKDFPIERIYRDARITSIYEGTTQLQAVAAIKGVTTGIYLDQIRQYDSQVDENNIELQKILQEMTSDFQNISAKITETQNSEVLDFHSRRLVEMAGNIIMGYLLVINLDFHSRRLVEMAGNIIMGYLLVINSQRDDHFDNSARIFIDLIRSENQEKLHYMNHFDFKNLDLYKIVQPQLSTE
jgi:hypothetical protein